MCTVTYVPQAAGTFILTSNRDESPGRSPGHLSREQLSGRTLIFPREPLAGGTWIAASDEGRTICLLNGAFELHERRLPYRKSRGLMVLDFWSYPRAADFFKRYDLDRMEPFTLVVIDRNQVWDFRWDGREKHLAALDPQQPHLWSSPTLYGQEARTKRQKWFEDWQQQTFRPGLPDILHFHRHAGEGDPWNDIVMDRNGVVKTVSITNIVRKTATLEVLYHDLLQEQVKKAKINLRGEVVENN